MGTRTGLGSFITSDVMSSSNFTGDTPGRLSHHGPLGSKSPWVTCTVAHLAVIYSVSLGVGAATEICTSSAALAATEGYRVNGEYIRMLL